MKNIFQQIKWQVGLIFLNLYCFFWIIPSSKLLKAKYVNNSASKQGKDNGQSNRIIQKFQCFSPILKSHIEAVYPPDSFPEKIIFAYWY
jgi:hypothetical protein